MRLIDADALMEILTTAIRNMKGMAKFLDAEDDPEIKMEIKAYTDILNGVKEQPTIELDLKWIPCSERLPEKEVDVLCCRDNKTMAIMHFNPVLTTRYPKGFSVVKDAFSWRQDNVIAWMPLPKTYKEGEQE